MSSQFDTFTVPELLDELVELLDELELELEVELELEELDELELLEEELVLSVAPPQAINTKVAVSKSTPRIKYLDNSIT